MKKIFILGVLALMATSLLSESQHSNFGSFWNFAEGKEMPQANFRQFHLDKFGKYINQNLSDFKKVELALLFGQIKYHFDNAMRLSDFHANPQKTILSLWRDSLDNYSESIEDFEKPRYREYQSSDDKFLWKMGHIAQCYARSYFELSPEEQTKANKSRYDSNGIHHPYNGAFRILEDTRKVAETFNKADIATTKQEVMYEAQSMMQAFRDSACVRHDAQHEFHKNYGPYLSHECMYAEHMLAYVKAAKELLEEESKNKAT
jgi:hypothetical protein